MRTITKSIFKYDELSDQAKEKARDWYREGGLDYEWWDHTYEDFERICEIIGINLSTEPVKLMNGNVRQDSKIYFNLSYSQSDGASFCGYYSYNKGSSKKIREYCNDKELIRIVDQLTEVQRKYFYKLQCYIKDHRDYGVKIDCSYETPMDAEDCMKECMDDLSSWLYKTLRDEYEYLSSDEQVEESIVCNEYEFYEDGSIA